MNPTDQKQPKKPEEVRARYLKRLTSLKSKRAGWEPKWRDLARFIRPRRTKFFTANSGNGTSPGQNDDEEIINNEGGQSLKTLESGMMAGITSPARPWFHMTTAPQLIEDVEVRDWLHEVEDEMRVAMAKSNTYKGFHELYGDLALFAPGVMIVESDKTEKLRVYNVPPGEYCLATNARGQVDTLYRETCLTVEQLVDDFGEENVSPPVRDMYRRGELDHEVEVVHVIEPRRNRDETRLDPANLPFASCWFEAKGDASTGLLRESGFHELPFVAPRWATSGNEVYGSSPGMDILGDVKALQIYERRKAQALEKIVDPPMGAPAELAGLDMAPGAVNYLPDAGKPGGQVAPLVVVPPQAIPAAEASIEKHERRIRAGFYADIWLMLTQSDGPQMTAEEVRARQQEKLMLLGPVMERLEDELLNPFIARVFGILLRNGYLPPPPAKLQGQDIHVEYISIMAQAQKLVATTGIERTVSFAIRIAEGTQSMEVFDKINTDKVMDEYADAAGVKPSLLRSEDEVAKLRADRAKAQQQAQAAQNAAAAAQSAKNLSQADTSGDNALTRLMGPVASAQVGGGA